jgi:hypothetical protein
MLTFLLPSVLCLLADKPAPPVALVLTVSGAITLEQKGVKPCRLGAGDLLRPGDRLAAGPDAEALLVFWDEERYERLKPKARATVGAKGCKPVEAVERVEGKKLPPAQVESLRELGRSGRRAGADLRGRPPATPQRVTPLYGATVLTDRPAFTWRPAEKVDSYRVELWSGDGRRRLWRATTTAARLDYPPKEAALKPGLGYQWRVMARRGEDEDPDPVVDSKFSTATKTEAADLAAVKELAAGDNHADLLLAAVMYEEHGVYGEALAVYEKLAAKRPEEANFQLALGNYYERGGRSEEAAAARAKAKKLGTGGAQ